MVVSASLHLRVSKREGFGQLPLWSWCISFWFNQPMWRAAYFDLRSGVASMILLTMILVSFAMWNFSENQFFFKHHHPSNPIPYFPICLTLLLKPDLNQEWGMWGVTLTAVLQLSKFHLNQPRTRILILQCFIGLLVPFILKTDMFFSHSSLLSTISSISIRNT